MLTAQSNGKDPPTHTHKLPVRKKYKEFETLPKHGEFSIQVVSSLILKIKDIATCSMKLYVSFKSVSHIKQSQIPEIDSEKMIGPIEREKNRETC